MSVAPMNIESIEPSVQDDQRPDTTSTKPDSVTEEEFGTDRVQRNMSLYSEPFYQEPPEPLNSGARYMREHYNDGIPLPEIVDNSFMGKMKRNRFKIAFYVFIISFFSIGMCLALLYFLL